MVGQRESFVGLEFGVLEPKTEVSLRFLVGGTGLIPLDDEAFLDESLPKYPQFIHEVFLADRLLPCHASRAETDLLPLHLSLFLLLLLHLLLSQHLLAVFLPAQRRVDGPQQFVLLFKPCEICLTLCIHCDFFSPLFLGSVHLLLLFYTHLSPGGLLGLLLDLGGFRGFIVGTAAAFLQFGHYSLQFFPNLSEVKAFLKGLLLFVNLEVTLVQSHHQTLSQILVVLLHKAHLSALP